MRVLHVILCCIYLKITFNTSAAKTAQCSITGFTLSLVSSRNRTGYWTSQVWVFCYQKCNFSWVCNEQELIYRQVFCLQVAKVKLMKPFTMCRFSLYKCHTSKSFWIPVISIIIISIGIIYSSPNTVSEIKPRSMRWAGHVAHKRRVEVYTGL